jgi:hypothetical protein
MHAYGSANGGRGWCARRAIEMEQLGPVTASFRQTGQSCVVVLVKEERARQWLPHSSMYAFKQSIVTLSLR